MCQLGVLGNGLPALAVRVDVIDGGVVKDVNLITGERMLEILMNGVSTRRYGKVIPEMADTAGVSRSAVSRQTIEASEAALKQLLERRFDELELRPRSLPPL